MKRTAASLVLLAATIAHGAPPAPHCTFARDPVIVCMKPDQAAAAWHMYGFNMRAAKDSNNRALLARANCTVIDHDAARHPILLDREGRLATQWGWTRVSLIDIDGNLGVWVANDYLHGSCEKWSDAAAQRDRELVGNHEQRPAPPAAPGSAFP